MMPLNIRNISIFIAINLIDFEYEKENFEFFSPNYEWFFLLKSFFYLFNLIFIYKSRWEG